jgi:hypothetical protein
VEAQHGYGEKDKDEGKGVEEHWCVRERVSKE